MQLIRKEPGKETDAEAAAKASADAGATTSAANAAQAMIGKMAADAKPINPGVAAAMPVTPNWTMAGPPVALTVVPASTSVSAGAVFQVSIDASEVRDLFAAPMQVQFDPKVLSLMNVDSGDLLGRDGQSVALVHRDEGNGAVTISATRPPGTKGVFGKGAICTLTFKAVAPGTSAVAITRSGLKDSQQKNIASTSGQATVQVK